MKKSLRHPKAEAEKRAPFCQKIHEHKANGRKIVFLDERGLPHSMPRTHGYAKRGERCFGTYNWGAKGRTHVIRALLGSALLTMSLFETTINTAVFNAWVIQDLLPKLPEKSVGVIENAPFHKGADMVKALVRAGHTLLYLPPYSPDLNPIEKKWAHVKGLRRKMGGSVKDLIKMFLL
jgi:transposase